MSFNGSGTFVVNSSGQPVVTGTVISSTAFNALTADLATGLSTCVTKDGQTATTVRVPFAFGISSTLTTDATSATTGSIITAGGISTQKALWVGTTSRLVGAVTADAGISSTLTTDATSATTGSIVTAGGISTQKALWVGTTSRHVGAATFDSTIASGAITSTGAVTGTALIPSSATIPANGYYLPSAGILGIATGSVKTITIDTATNITPTNALISVFGFGNGPGICLNQNADNANSNWYAFRKSRGTAASPTIVQNGDGLGDLSWQAYDGTAYNDTAHIGAAVDGAVTSGQKPGAKLVFYTNTPNGAQTLNLTIAGSGAATFASTIASGAITSSSTIQATTGIAVGAATPGAGGLAFPATAVAVTDANTLDDYEEGTWTPVLVGATTTTYTAQVATYTKIGRIVHVRCQLTINSLGDGNTTGLVLPLAGISGLEQGGICVGFFSSLATAVIAIFPAVGSGSTTLTIYSTTAAATGSSSSAIFGNGARIQFGGTYQV